MSFWRAIAIVTVVVWPTVGRGHVGPDPDRNNRYLKISPLGDRVRLSYTIWIGEAPGRAARARLDEDRDGVVSVDEAKGYGDDLAQMLEEGVEVHFDGSPRKIHWEDAIVGLGTPETLAGAFAIDRVGWLCFDGAGEHAMRTVDRVALPMPGETEVRVESGPGIEIRSSELRGLGDRLGFSWLGEKSPLEDGLRVVFAVDSKQATFAGHDVCRTPPPTDRPPPRLPLIALALGLAFALTGGAVLVARRRRNK